MPKYYYSSADTARLLKEKLLEMETTPDNVRLGYILELARQYLILYDALVSALIEKLGCEDNCRPILSIPEKL